MELIVADTVEVPSCWTDDRIISNMLDDYIACTTANNFIELSGYLGKAVRRLSHNNKAYSHLYEDESRDFLYSFIEDLGFSLDVEDEIDTAIGEFDDARYNRAEANHKVTSKEQEQKKPKAPKEDKIHTKEEKHESGPNQLARTIQKEMHPSMVHDYYYATDAEKKKLLDSMGYSELKPATLKALKKLVKSPLSPQY